MVSRQKQERDLGFGELYEPVAARREVEQIPASRSTRSFGAKQLLMVGGLLIVGVIVFGFMKFLSSAGKQIGSDNQRIVGQVDKTKDAEAKIAGHNVLTAAKTVFVSSGSYTSVDPVSLAATEPTYRYTTGPSTGADVVSVSSSATQLGIAVSAGKTCWYLSDSAAGTTFGSGTGACTGAVAIRVAKAPAWRG
jgi:hypothetical protein